MLDLKFTTKLEENKKAKDLANYAAQVRLYTFMLGQLHGFMPRQAYLFTCDRVADPLSGDELQSALANPELAVRKRMSFIGKQLTRFDGLIYNFPWIWRRINKASKERGAQAN